MVTDGIDATCSWTSSRGIDAFSKKMLFIPVNKNLHWFLCVVFHPGSVTQFTDHNGVDVEVPFILFLDPLDSHSRKEICQNLCSWLDGKWSKKQTSTTKMFTPLTIESFAPQGNASH
jgi:Ulp1 family protease